MTEENLLYDALSTTFGLIVRGERKRFAQARRRLLETDPAMHELTIIGPDNAGQIYLLRTKVENG